MNRGLLQVVRSSLTALPSSLVPFFVWFIVQRVFFFLLLNPQNVLFFFKLCCEFASLLEYSRYICTFFFFLAR